MEIRGTRECRSCGRQWSYYETGTIRCPDCGAIRSVGIDERRQLHTDGAAELDLEPVREALADEPLARVAATSKTDFGAIRTRGDSSTAANSSRSTTGISPPGNCSRR